MNGEAKINIDFYFSNTDLNMYKTECFFASNKSLFS